MIVWQEDLSPLQHRMSCARLEDIVDRGYTRESNENQPQCRSTTGRAPLFYAREPGPDTPTQLRPPQMPLIALTSAASLGARSFKSTRCNEVEMRKAGSTSICTLVLDPTVVNHGPAQVS
ncbi:hypothetical protein MRX96_016934 [Rhipicephalus microplus]